MFFNNLDENECINKKNPFYIYFFKLIFYYKL